MFGVGDELAVRLFFLANAVAVGLYAMTVAGWNHKVLVWCTFGLSFSLVLLAILWPQVTWFLPSLVSIKISPIYWFALITVGVIVVLMRESFARKRLFVHIENLSSGREAIPTEKPATREAQFKAAIFDKTNARGPIFRFVSLKAQLSVGVFVDISAYYSAGLIGAGAHPWTQPKRLQLKRFTNVYKGQMLTGEIFRKAQWNNSEFWTFHTEDTPIMENLLNASTDYRCRVVLIPSMKDEEEEYFYFICRPTSLEDQPTVIGQHLFGHMLSWEGGNERAENDAESLYSHG